MRGLGAAGGSLAVAKRQGGMSSIRGYIPADGALPTAAVGELPEPPPLDRALPPPPAGGVEKLDALNSAYAHCT